MERGKNKILLGPSSFGAIDKTPLKMLAESGMQVVDNPYKRRLTKGELLDLLPGIVGIIAGLEPLDREVLEKSELKVISRCGSGLSNVDLNAAKEKGMIVKNTPLAPAFSVAELTIGCLFALLRQVPQMDAALHQRKWEKKIGRQLAGMTVAVIGFGNIGRLVGRMLKALGAEVIAVDPLLTGIVEGITILDLNKALSQADVITLHCSGEGLLLGESEFGLMKKRIYLLNAARGSLIDEKTLLAAITSGQVAGAWLDTFQDEPYSGPLCDFPQVILTPHVGSYTEECRKSMEMESATNLIEALREGTK
ncbi:phosphoglycerate dehydrogenase [Candidatus Margulisiibacteriota bacterium]